MNEIIKTNKLTKYYGKTLAVDNVDLSINEGEILGFIGLNGAGKTTTIRMLLGMISPTTGQCYLRGENVSQGGKDLWNDIGYIVETPYSYPELTVRENLEIVRKLRGIKDKNCVDWIIHKLKLENNADKLARNLSLGNSQRLGIAKAIIHKPKILILDEPTNGLDPEGIVEVRELLQDLAKNVGVTILISSHKLAEISKIATNIAIIHNGRLIKEIDVIKLESQLKKKLILDGKDKEKMTMILSRDGYKIEVNEFNNLEILCDKAVKNPDKIATTLVKEGCPPTLLKIDIEDLEAYFLRTIKEGDKK